MTKVEDNENILAQILQQRPCYEAFVFCWDFETMCSVVKINRQIREVWSNKNVWKCWVSTRSGAYNLIEDCYLYNSQRQLWLKQIRFYCLAYELWRKTLCPDGYYWNEFVQHVPKRLGAPFRVIKTLVETLQLDKQSVLRYLVERKYFVDWRNNSDWVSAIVYLITSEPHLLNTRIGYEFTFRNQRDKTIENDRDEVFREFVEDWATEKEIRVRDGTVFADIIWDGRVDILRKILCALLSLSPASLFPPSSLCSSPLSSPSFPSSPSSVTIKKEEITSVMEKTLRIMQEEVADKDPRDEILRKPLLEHIQAARQLCVELNLF